MEELDRFDVVVLGAGVGGLSAAALLAHAGRRTLVVERLDRVGGRASSEQVEGFTINVGAVGLELGGPMQAVFDTVGARYEVREPDQLIAARFGGRNYNLSSRMCRFLIDDVAVRAGGVWARHRWPADQPPGPGDESFQAWLERFTSRRAVHRLARSISAALLSANPHEVSARAILTYFTRYGAFRRFGYCPGGTIAPMRELAGVVERRGGAVWLESSAKRLEVSYGRVTGVVVAHGGATRLVPCDHVVSNLGPRGTNALVGAGDLPEGYRARVEVTQRSAAMITFHLASRAPLMGRAGLVFFADTVRVCGLAYLSSCCPELAPDGWHQYVVGAVPDPAVGDFDADREIALARAELYRAVPAAASARELAVRVMRDEWPCQRAVIGHDLERDTPITNLFNVGDAVRPYPTAGTQGCAESARLVVEEILSTSRQAGASRSRRTRAGMVDR
jgi:phytoene desaturase